MEMERFSKKLLGAALLFRLLLLLLFFLVFLRNFIFIHRSKGTQSEGDGDYFVCVIGTGRKLKQVIF